MTDPNAQPPADPASGQPSAQTAPPLSPAEDKQWAMLSHFLNIILLIPALIIYLVFKDRGQLVRSESKEALNWTINICGLLIISNILIVIFGLIPFIGWLIALLLTLVTFALVIVNIIFAILGGVKVNNGGTYRYPVNYRWIK